MYAVMWGYTHGTGAKAGDARARMPGKVRNTNGRPECPKE